MFPYEVAGAVFYSLGFLAFAFIGLGLKSMTPARDPNGAIMREPSPSPPGSWSCPR